MKQANIKEEKIVKLLEGAPPDIKDNIMTTYDQIISRGKQLGVEESKTNTVLNGVKDNIPVDVLARLTELPVEEVKRIIQEHND